MKFWYLTIFFCFLFAACNSKNSDLEQRVEDLEDKMEEERVKPTDNENLVSTGSIASGNLPVLSFKKKSFDFGRMKAGETVRHTFEFTNTGESPLIIQNAAASCGCTVPDWPHSPIGPGDSGKIEVEFNSTGKNGSISKNIAITANTDPAITTVTISALVESQ